MFQSDFMSHRCDLSGEDPRERRHQNHQFKSGAYPPAFTLKEFPCLYSTFSPLKTLSFILHCKHMENAEFNSNSVFSKQPLINGFCLHQQGLVNKYFNLPKIELTRCMTACEWTNKFEFFSLLLLLRSQEKWGKVNERWIVRRNDWCFC